MTQRRLAFILICLLLLSAGFLPLAVHASRTGPAQSAPTSGLTSLDGGVAGFLQRQGMGIFVEAKG